MTFSDNPTPRRPVQAVPIRRILDKLDSYLSRRDYEAAEKHLLCWLSEAERGGDRQGQLMLCNELIGNYRKTGKETEALLYADRALALLRELDLENSMTAGTTYVNAATAYNAFGRQEQALQYFEKARVLYESLPAVSPSQLGSLYNNMGLCCAASEHYEDAMQLYEKALVEMAKAQNGVLEQAITLLNMADCVAAQLGTIEGESRISELVQEASARLKTEGVPHDSYYAFVCEKCAPTFLYYGYFAIASELQREAERIYEGT